MANNLVSRLNQILEQFTGKTITRSTKSQALEYVKIVCRIADPKIGPGTITEAMRREIKHYKPRGEITPKSEAVISPPIPCDKRLAPRTNNKRRRCP